MSRPEPQIIHIAELDDGSTWDILQADSYFVITYLGQPCGIRQHKRLKSGFKYMKLSYTNLGNAEAQCRKLNQRFKTNDFAVVEVI